MKKIILLAVLSSFVLSEDYFCNYKGGFSGSNEGIVIIERQYQGVIVNNQNVKTKFKVLRDDSEVLLFQYIENNLDGTLGMIDTRSIKKKSNRYTHHMISMTYPEVSYYFEGKCLKND